jgi:hypothetical protein
MQRDEFDRSIVAALLQVLFDAIADGVVLPAPGMRLRITR